MSTTTTKPLSQKERILKTLRRRTRIGLTEQQAKADFGIASLSSRVRELRDDGYPIVSVPFVREPDGKTCVRYLLAQ
jgi:Helix-turn-helix domain